MADGTSPDKGGTVEPVETGQTATDNPNELEDNADPGPIEVGYVMRNIRPALSDPATNRDLHLGKRGDDAD